MNELLKPIDVNQMFRDAQRHSQCLETFELTWEEKKDLVDATPTYINTQYLTVGKVLVPIIKIKYFDNE